MKLEVIQNTLILKQVFNPIVLKTENGNEFYISMRDNGLEIQLNDELPIILSEESFKTNDTKKPIEEFLHDELIAFATFFSKNFKNLGAGVINSKNNNYQIDFSTAPLKFAVSHERPMMLIDRETILQNNVSEEFVFYQIIWAFCHYKLIKKSIEQEVQKEINIDFIFKTTDELIAEYYISKGKSLQPVIDDYQKVFESKLKTNAEFQARFEYLKSKNNQQKTTKNETN